MTLPSFLRDDLGGDQWSLVIICKVARPPPPECSALFNAAVWFRVIVSVTSQMCI